jgi:hypothetical protein
VTIKANLGIVQGGLDGERKTSHLLSVRCARLEVLAFSVGWTWLLGTLFVAAGAGMVGFASGWPGIADNEKIWLCAGGTMIGAAGLLVMTLAFAIGWYGKPKSDETLNP